MAIMTKNVSDLVKRVTKILNDEPCIRLNMKRGLINIRALARYIINEKKVDATLDAVISIIRRYHLKERYDIFEKARSALKNIVSISAKNQLVAITLVKDEETQQILPKLFSIIHYNQGDVLRIIQADQSIKIFVDRKNLDKIKGFFPEDKILGKVSNLAEINIHVNPEDQMPPGVCAVITNELAVNNINIIEGMSCYPESLWFVDENAVTKAYDVICKLCNL